jgi:DNA polymerase III alpha subunit (gram-positive type)
MTHISAVCGEDSFSMYIIPEVPITAQASKVTGLTYDGYSMFSHGKPVVYHTLQHALDNFGKCLSSFKDPVHFAHNCRKFDSLILCNAIKKVPSVQLDECFGGFCDTLEFFRATIPFLEKFSLQCLVSNVLNISYTAHDALEDSKVLQRLTELPQHAVEDYYLKYTFDISSTCDIVSLQVQSKKKYET